MISTSNRPDAFSQSYLGPELPNNIPRLRLSYSSNKAPAYVPDALLSPGYFRAFLGEPVENHVQKVSVDQALLSTLKGDIENHVEARIQNFITQLMIVYKTGIQFSPFTHAEIQIGKAKTRGDSAGFYGAAHSSTLPALRILSSRSSRTSISFAKDSSFYHGWNMTVYLPTVVNQLDAKIDSSSRHQVNGKDFRARAIHILNTVSEGECIPKEGLREFLEAMIRIIEAEKHGEADSMNLELLDIYHRIAERYHENIDNGYPLFQKLFLRAIDEKIDERFYFRVQAEIHSKLIREMDHLRPRYGESINSAKEFNVEDLKNRLMVRISCLSTRRIQRQSRSKKRSPTIEDVKICTRSKRVEESASNYFNYLHTLSSSRKDRELNLVLEIKSSRTISNLGLSPAALSFYQAVMSEINQKKRENINQLLLSILHAYLEIIEKS